MHFQRRSVVIIISLFTKLICFAAVEKSIKASDIGNKDAAFREYLAAVENKSNTQAREIAKDILGKEVFWNWDRKYRINRHLAAGTE